MLKRSFDNLDLFRILVVLFDFICFQASLVISYILWVRIPWHGNWQYFSEFSIIMWMLPPLALIVFKAIGLYKPGMGVIGVQEQSLIFKGIWIIYLVLFCITFFYREINISRIATLYSMFLSLTFISIERYFVRRLYSYLNERGYARRRALVYGAGYHGVRLTRWIRQTPHLGIQVMGYLDDDADMLKKVPQNPPILGGIRQLEKLANQHDVSLLFISHRALSEEKVIETIQICRELKIQCWVIPALYQMHVERIEVQHIGGIPLLGFKEQFSIRVYELIKPTFDFLAATFLTILSLPILIMVGASVYMTSGAPVFFKQVRVGRNHREFQIYKFRTMKFRRKMDDISPELQKNAKKSLTPIGAFLRRTGLDEIPQLLNVFRGEMSLVGPRPEMPFLVKKYGPLERERLTVKPGITGLWQISDDRKRLLIHENMDYDLYYVEHMSFNLDLAILFKTVVAILKRVLPKKEK